VLECFKSRGYEGLRRLKQRAVFFSRRHPPLGGLPMV
jgi:hypothetical protein